MKKPNHRVVIPLVVLLCVPLIVLVLRIARARQTSDLRIVSLQNEPILRIDATGSVFDGIDSKIAVINDREGSLTLLKDRQTIIFKNDPTIQRNNDRYTVKLGGESNIIDVKPDSSVLLNGIPHWKASGYSDADAQRNRFVAALVVIPLLNLTMDAPDDFSVMLPSGFKNAGPDPAIRRESIIWIPSNDEIYVGSQRISKGDFDSRLNDEVDELLKRQSGTNKVVYIAASASVDYAVVVRAIRGLRAAKGSVRQVGLIVEGSGGRLADRFLVVIPDQDP